MKILIESILVAIEIIGMFILFILFLAILLVAGLLLQTANLVVAASFFFVTLILVIFLFKTYWISNNVEKISPEEDFYRHRL